MLCRPRERLRRGESRFSGRNRTIVNTVSLLRLVPVGSIWRRQYWQRIAWANIGKVILQPWNVDHDHLHGKLLIEQTSYGATGISMFSAFEVCSPLVEQIRTKEI